MARRSKNTTRPPEHFLELVEVLEYVGQVMQRGLPGAVWVRAEVASITDRRHLYLELIQLGSGGELAKCRATLWARERYELEGKFRQITGGLLTAGLKVLLFCTAEFHAQYGFSLHILDIAPEFTVGEAVQRLQAMREQLVQEGVYGLNRLKTAPDDFARLVVISPQEAAGLDDFRRETLAFEQLGVLDIQYLTALFQGQDASGSLQRALTEAAALHERKPLDALVLIRGGGAVADLAWLNDLAVARALATFPAPVITGLGHARDDTLLDEVAHTRTDTPSKAAHLVVSTLLAAAQQAQEDLGTIRQQGASALVNAQASLLWTRDRLRQAAGQRLNTEQSAIEHLMKQALGLTPQRTLARGYVLVRDQAGQPVTSAAQVRPQQPLRLYWADGEVRVEVVDLLEDTQP